MRMSPYIQYFITYKWRALAQTVIFCLAIALLLSFVEQDEGFLENLVISLCIGLSIHLSSIIIYPILEAYLPTFFIGFIAITLGLLLSLALSGLYVANDPGHFFRDSSDILPLGILFGIVGTIIFYTLARLSDVRVQLELAEKKQLAQEKQLAESQLRILQAQIEPHFLFNTLSNVISMVDHDKESAKQTLVNLTTLLRSSLQRTRAPFTTLADELELVCAYLDIQKIRLGERLTYSIDIPEALQASEIPPLLLQPLVENSVCHGIEPLEEGGHIQITGSFTGPANDTYCLRVADTGKGLSDNQTDMQSSARKGVGLNNVRERLLGIFGKQARFSISENSPQGLIVSLTIPYDENK